jgi:acyl-coenzyme A synthetase/AMP-(fatty) acid ligase
MTPDYIAFHAAERPRDIAVIVQGRSVSYQDLLGDVRRFSAALRALGLLRGARLAVQCADPYSHWLILVAAEALGLVTLSLADGEDTEAAALQVRLDFILWQQSAPLGLRAQQVSDGWLQRVRAGAAGEEAAIWPQAPEDCVRITRTSGTTGTPKSLEASRRIVESWIFRWIASYAIAPGARCLALLPFTVAAAYTLSLAVARAGATLVFETRTRPWQAIAELAITHLLLFPLSLERMVEEVPPSFVKPDRLRLISLGSRVPAAIRQKVLVRLATELSDHYGANEIGTIAANASADPKAHFTVRPGVQVEIVDDQDRVLPLGEAGAIRVRSPDMYTQYLDDPEATAAMFRGGWFYPGDACVLHPSRQLEVLGRNDTLLNIGGYKFAPSGIEEALRVLAGGDDVAVSSLPNADGIEELCVAVTGARVTAHAQSFAPVLRGMPGRIRLVPLAAIPRAESGKIRREALRAELLKLSAAAPGA